MAMNGYTSGTQALQDRKVNHDPEPWEAMTGEGFERTTFKAAGSYLDPRPDFDVLDNPILAEFRSDQDGTYERICWWLAMLEENVYPSWTPEQIDHAIRVLTKLAALA